MAERAPHSPWTGLWGFIEGMSFDLTTAEEFLEGLGAWEEDASVGEEEEVVDEMPGDVFDCLGGEIEEMRGGVWDVLDALDWVAVGEEEEEEEEGSVYFDAVEVMPCEEDVEAGEWLEVMEEIREGRVKMRDERFGGWLDELLAEEFLHGGFGVEVLGEVTVHSRGGEVRELVREEGLVGKGAEEEEKEQVLVDVGNTPKQDEEQKTEVEQQKREDEQVSAPLVDVTPNKQQQQQTENEENDDTSPAAGPSQQTKSSKRRKKKAELKAKTASAPVPADSQAQTKGKQTQAASPSEPQPPPPKKINYAQAIDKMIIIDMRKNAFPYAKLFDNPNIAADIAAEAGPSSTTALMEYSLTNPNHLVIWTDGSWSDTSTYAGVSVVLHRQDTASPSDSAWHEHGYTVLPPIPAPSSRTRPAGSNPDGFCYEMLALGLGLERALEQVENNPDAIKNITMFSDSQDALQGIHKNLMYFFTGKFGSSHTSQIVGSDSTSAAGVGPARLTAPPSRKLQTFETGCKCVKRLWELGKVVEIRWAPGHSGIEGNERADRVAKLAARYGCLSSPFAQVQVQAQAQGTGQGGDVVKNGGGDLLLTPPASEGEDEVVVAGVSGGLGSGGAHGGVITRADIKIMRLPVPVLTAIHTVMSTVDNMHSPFAYPIRVLKTAVARQVVEMLRTAGREEDWVLGGHGI